MRNLDKNQNGVLSVIKYQNICITLESPLLSWRNLFFCSNNYGCAPDYQYMNNAVQNGTKTAATIYMNDTDVYKSFMDTLPTGIHAAPYGNYSKSEHPVILFVYRDGSLASYFNFEQVMQVYRGHSVDSIDWERVKYLIEKPMNYFANEDECGFSLQSCRNNHTLVVTGLLLGYPVESTIAWLKGDISVKSETL